MFLRGGVRSLVGRGSVEPRELQRTFDSFGAAVREEDVVQSRPLREFFRERPLERVVIKVRKVNRARGFAANRLHDARMRVTQRIHGDPAEKIEVFFAAGIKYIAATPVRQHERSALVRW